MTALLTTLALSIAFAPFIAIPWYDRNINRRLRWFATLTVAVWIVFFLVPLLSGCQPNKTTNYMVVALHQESKVTVAFYLSVPSGCNKLEVIEEYNRRMDPVPQDHKFTILNVVNLSEP